ncbi:MAG: diacylglycerol kinase [Lysobacterales bacterium RIFOXYD1_FULL_69_11]|nr:MAG: diacylglycerol kinase [Xanthomonadales bacterium RIFOXYA1_FULL_69_10]OHE86421.1 MAG: diacylglycerol kinase [Xanthomonadales bacterium RIFOXYD1_FULL_69_11]
MKARKTGLNRVIAAAGNSWRGLRACWINEAAFRQEVVLAVPLLVAAGVWQVGGVERALMMAAVLQVLVVELLNSGIEAAIDRIGPEHHPLSALAKDAGSAAVTVSLLLAVVVWVCILM